MRYLKLIRISFDMGICGTFVLMVICIRDSQQNKKFGSNLKKKIKQLSFNDFLYLFLISKYSQLKSLISDNVRHRPTCIIIGTLY